MSGFRPRPPRAAPPRRPLRRLEALAGPGGDAGLARARAGGGEPDHPGQCQCFCSPVVTRLCELWFGNRLSEGATAESCRASCCHFHKREVQPVRWGHPARAKVVLFVGDTVLVFLALVLAAFLRLGEATNVFRVYTGATLVFSLTFLSLLYILDLYNLEQHSDGRVILFRLGVAGGLGALLSAASFYFLPGYRTGRGILLLAVLVLALLAYGWRLLVSRQSGTLLRPSPVLVLGTGKNAEALRRLLVQNHSHYRLAGFLRTEEETSEHRVPEELVRGRAEELHGVVAQERVRSLVVASDSYSPALASALTRLKFEGIRIHSLTDFSLRVAEELPTEFLTDSWLWFAEGFNLLEARLMRKVKRLSDLVLAGLGLLVTLPVSVLAAVAIKLDSCGPVLHRQERVGWMERPFTLYKFRSMQNDAERGNGAQWAAPDDPRVTRVGRVLRKLHLDEIPQMVNVLRGEMSFIGPRPERPEFVAELKRAIPFYHLRHYVPPGLTGWAQVNYPYGASGEDAKRKLEYDLYYILHASPLLDLRILLRTARVVLFRQGSR